MIRNQAPRPDRRTEQGIELVLVPYLDEGWEVNRRKPTGLGGESRWVDDWLAIQRHGIARATRRRPRAEVLTGPAARVCRGHAIVIVRTGTRKPLQLSQLLWLATLPWAHSTRAAHAITRLPIHYLLFVRKTALTFFFFAKSKEKARRRATEQKAVGTLAGNLFGDEGCLCFLQHDAHNTRTLFYKLLSLKSGSVNLQLDQMITL